MKKILILLLAATFLLGACEKRRENKQDEEILAYLAANNLNAEVTSDGIYYIIDAEGTGKRPTIFDQVVVDYEGSLLDGTVFDSSFDRGQPATFPLSSVIVGWQKGIPLFKEGGAGHLIIPSRYAYGKNPPSGSPIGKHEILVFRIELIEVI